MRYAKTKISLALKPHATTLVSSLTAKKFSGSKSSKNAEIVGVFLKLALYAYKTLESSLTSQRVTPI